MSRIVTTIDDVLTYITEHSAVKNKERHQHGEVFTPVDLAEEMLDTLPAAVWHNPDLRWLDPANGIGVFPVLVFRRLMTGLKNKIPDEQQRAEHIIQNMLFMVDINARNNAIARRLFKKLCPSAEPNVEQVHRTKGFLVDKAPFGHKEFDIIMGNPPYQGGTVRSKMTNKTRKKREAAGVAEATHTNLWIPFVRRSLTLLKPHGYLLFIHPVGWFKPERTGIHKEMMSKRIHTIRVFHADDSKKMFRGSGEIHTAYYLLENAPNTHGTKTRMVEADGAVHHVLILSSSILGLTNNDILAKIQKKARTFDETGTHHQAKVPSTQCSDDGTFEHIYSLTEDGTLTVEHSIKEHPNQREPKLILSGYQTPRVLNNQKGKFGLIGSTDTHYLTEIEEGDLKQVADYFKTKLASLVMKSMKYRNKFIEPGLYPDVRTIPEFSGTRGHGVKPLRGSSSCGAGKPKAQRSPKKITDKLLADVFGLTMEQRRRVQNIIPSSIRRWTRKVKKCSRSFNE